MAETKWIKSAIKKPGALHKELGVKEGKKIPEAKLKKAEHSKNPKHVPPFIKGEWCASPNHYGFHSWV